MKKIISVRGDKNFTKWRGGDVSRLEALTDAVFAIAITLLIVSHDVPRDYAHFKSVMWGFFGFGVTFFALIAIWYNTFKFHRRYGLEDGYTIFLTTSLIFLVLFYIYPLKFMAQIVINEQILKNSFGIDFDVGFIGNIDASHLFLVYGIGVFSIWFILGLMHVHAYRKRKVLKLDNSELEITTDAIVANFIVSLVAILSISATLLNIPYISGWIYFLISPLIFIALLIKGKYFKIA